MALNLATKEEIEKIKTLAFKVNDFMKSYFSEIGVELIDFKLEFGRFKGDIILADEISPDTCRFWDAKTERNSIKTDSEEIWTTIDKGYREMMKRMGLSK